MLFFLQKFLFLIGFDRKITSSIHACPGKADLSSLSSFLSNPQYVLEINGTPELLDGSLAAAEADAAADAAADADGTKAKAGTA